MILIREWSAVLSSQQFTYGGVFFCKHVEGSNIISEVVLARGLTCPLSKKTECFNKDSPLNKFSLRGAASPWAASVTKSHLGDSLFHFEREEKSQCGTDCFSAADLAWSRQQKKDGQSWKGERGERVMSKMVLPIRSIMLSWLYNLSSSDGIVIPHKHIHSLQRSELPREPRTQI